MTARTNARIAGAAFLIYIAAGITSMVVFRRAAAGQGMAARLASLAAHPTEAGILVLLGFVQAFSAVVLAVTLYAITREQDEDLAMLGLSCRLGEGIIGGLAVATTPALLWLATSIETDAATAAASHRLGAYLLRGDIELPATFFAVGSTFFSYLLLRGRMIPVSLAWLGVVASVLLVVVLPLSLAGFVRGLITSLIWLPMLAFEVPLALWLMTRGVATPQRARA